MKDSNIIHGAYFVPYWNKIHFKPSSSRTFNHNIDPKHLKTIDGGTESTVVLFVSGPASNADEVDAVPVAATVGEIVTKVGAYRADSLSIRKRPNILPNHLARGR